jgi:4-amino-4-deoxy-L-arabinose transferase-like glycosyltransferase
MKLSVVVWALVAVFFASNIAVALGPPAISFWDERTYGTAASRILEGQSCPTIGTPAAPLSTPCNYEHPPLAKALGAVSLYVFGSVHNATAPGSLPSRLTSLLSTTAFPLVLGALSIPLLYSIAYDVSGEKRLALVAAVSLLMEPLFALFSRVDYLDITMVFFGLCAYAVYFGRKRLGPANEYVVSGVFLALSILSKETGLVFLAPLVVYHLLFREAGWGTRLREVAIVVGVGVAGSVLGLQLYDTLAVTPFPSFVNNVAYMVEFSNSLVCSCNNPGVGPWYFFLTSNYWMVGVSYNPALLWSAFAWVPLGLFFVLRAARDRAAVDPAGRLFVISLVLLAVTFLTNELVYLGGRIVWVWYFLPAVPALALGEAYLLTRGSIPRWVRALLGGALVAGYLLAYLMGPDLLIYD